MSPPRLLDDEGPDEGEGSDSGEGAVWGGSQGREGMGTGIGDEGEGEAERQSDR